MRGIKQRKTHEVHAEELQITSLMDILMTLIFFLIQYAVVLHVSMLDTPIPKVVEQSDATPPPEKKEPFSLKATIANDGILVESNAIPGGRKEIKNLPAGGLDVETFHGLIIALKSRYLDERQISILPMESITYQQIVTVMDAARELTPQDPDLPGRPRDKTRDPVQWELFPEVVMEGVY